MDALLRIIGVKTKISVGVQDKTLVVVLQIKVFLFQLSNVNNAVLLADAESIINAIPCISIRQLKIRKICFPRIVRGMNMQVPVGECVPMPRKACEEDRVIRVTLLVLKSNATELVVPIKSLLLALLPDKLQ